MNKIIISTLPIFFIILSSMIAADNKWLTYYEQSNYLETPRYQETIDYCKRLADHSPILKYTHFGVSPQGREMPLLILDKSQQFDPEYSHQHGKAVTLFQAGIHSGEIEGKDAGLMLLRDIVVEGKYQDMLENTVLLFIPIFSVDGHERFSANNRVNQNGPKQMGWRTTAQNLNLNRDFLKADTPEMRFWLELFNLWLPDFLADIHTSDGADYQYTITYGIEYDINVSKPLADWTKEAYLPKIKDGMKSAGYDFVQYIVPKYGHDIKKGAMAFIATPRYSNGYGVIQNRPFVLIETHMLKPYKERVESVYHYFLQTLNIVNKQAEELKRVVQEADRKTAEELVGTVLPLSFRPSRDSVMGDFLGVEYHFEKSDISGSDKIIWGDKKVTYKIPFFYQGVPTTRAKIPYAYIIPKEWQNQLNILNLHGVKIHYLKKAVELEVESYRFVNPEWNSEPFEGHHRLNVEINPFMKKEIFPSGTAVVILNQRTNRVIAHLIEPKAPDSFVRWGFFDQLLEQKEYVEDYRMETIAENMLSENEDLRIEFENKLKADSNFASSPEQRLDFFYQHSPYIDQQYNIYPISRLLDKIPLEVW